MHRRAFALMTVLLLAGVACSSGDGHTDEDSMVVTPSDAARAELTTCERYLVVSSARAVAREVYNGSGAPGHRAASYRRAYDELVLIAPPGGEKAFGQGALLLANINNAVRNAESARQIREGARSAEQTALAISLAEEFEQGFLAAGCVEAESR